MTQQQLTANLVTFTKKTPNGKLHFLCSVLSFLALYHTATFSATQYLSYLHQGPAIRFHILCLSQKSGEIFVREMLVFLSRPPLAFEQFPSYWKKGQEMQFVIRVKNPLKVELTDCVLRLDGNLMEGRLTLPQR